MMAGDYPEAVARAFTHPAYLLAPEAEGAVELARVRTPAAPVIAAVYRHHGVIRWRATGCPFLVATLDHLCALLAAGLELEQVEQALNDWELPPVKRYCLVMARDLLQSLRRHVPGVEEC